MDMPRCRKKPPKPIGVTAAPSPQGKNLGQPLHRCQLKFRNEDQTYPGWWCFATPLKNMKVSWMMRFPTEWENQTCSKLPRIIL